MLTQIRVILNRIRFSLLPVSICDISALGHFTKNQIDSLFSDSDIHLNWNEDCIKLLELCIPETAGGVNPGDRRALYYITRSMNACNILEIGTHIGSSTTALALAMSRNQGVKKLITVDILDVNNELSRVWETAQSPASPASFVKRLNLAHFVHFRVSNAVNQLTITDSELFDLIFLDGDHSAAAVYTEIELALKKLKVGGIIVLHDYFPNGEAIWKGKAPLLGPWLAVSRYNKENAPFKVVPLGELPWPTKCGSNQTSLAIVSKV